MIYIGIDPEPSGAWCLWNNIGGRIYFYTSSTDPRIRAMRFLEVYHNKEFDNWDHKQETKIFIEDTWIRPYQSAKADAKTIKSFGIWLGILYTIGFSEEEVNIIAPSKWKKKLELSDDKMASYDFARSLIIDPNESLREPDISNREEALKQINIPGKQGTDRCEAFLIAYYGRYFFDENNEKD